MEVFKEKRNVENIGQIRGQGRQQIQKCKNSAMINKYFTCCCCCQNLCHMVMKSYLFFILACQFLAETFRIVISEIQSAESEFLVK